MMATILRFSKLFLIMLVFTASSTAQQGFSMKDQFEGYIQAVNDHDIDRVMGFLADDFQLHFTEYEMTLSKAQMRDVLGWDKGVNGKVTYDQLKMEADSITGIFTERNEFFKLLGIDSLRAEVKYRFDNSGLISVQTYRALPDQPSFQNELEPAVEWARKNRPDEIAEIYPQDQINFNEEMGRRWVALLKEWRQATRE